ncbi:hypothetical protein CPB84DRAFT_1853645 [Gymnopilus junonius]|uniref:Uncharacterized protein n=1 Tax=Gymnopilus junonius TaxID=109634 RepID=A0A9P5NB65_GYMJU|nr:hypothetical protein CPB84DRAFT_1853645 [Gymnopilus junonius]
MAMGEMPRLKMNTPNTMSLTDPQRSPIRKTTWPGVVPRGMPEGSSVFTMLEKIDKATCRAYSPRGYEAADFERTFLIYKLGGRAAADIAHRSLGTPSIDATKRHIITSPIHASSGFPTLPELSSNLAACYPPRANGPDVVVTPRWI